MGPIFSPNLNLFAGIVSVSDKLLWCFRCTQFCGSNSNKEDININLSDGLLTIKGEKKQEKKEKNEKYRCVERRYGKFFRTMRLRSGVEADKVDVIYKDGVLEITLQKSEAVKAKEIEIKS